jgi:hypothetical protein
MSFSESVNYLRAAVLSFLFGLFSGGVLIPIVHVVLCKQSDPFEHGWPLCLQVSALLLSLIIALSLRCTATVALGVFVGLVGWMLVSARAEYPVSSAIGLLIHGFIPGALGSVIAFVILRTRAGIRRPPAANKAVNPSGGSGGFK